MKNHKSHKLSNLNINGAISEVYMMNCVEAMKQYPDKHFSLACVDPPYGININMNMGRRKGEKKKHKDKEWDNDIPSIGYFKELFRVSQQQIIFGGNYFTDYLRPTQAWIFWDKDVNENVSFSDGELAWTSFKMITRKVFIPYSGFRGADKDGRYHPTQKPVALYDWIFKNYAKEGDLILDTHLGSQSSRIAANKANLDFIGFEIDEDYFNEGNERFKNFVSQMRLF